ncbi:hypothetical protein COT52_02720 [candidate division WWE3 bacterium CG08_land_8_20_14_0_20_43_13]|uniref:GDP-mannose 4,6-dehydratase n=1 Tax=candidate division WWE3 bacterium CG08_land_8_20_14_0_20_43_13 TaxID=1975087 RepID=A0A2H0X6U1_UNCKA|nr:MAG: hypothetical protein COT52_02720 [candidate division WWE3 bacterium CG08_land_8_20_14_0_20_43_13]
MVKSLITGITGFVGSHLAELLLSKDEEVWGTYRWRSPRVNIKQIEDKVHLINCELLDQASVLNCLEKVRPEVIYHLAAQSYVASSFDEPAFTLENNIIGTLNLLEAVKRLKIDPIIHVCSSSEVYGQVKEDEVPIRETNPFRPASPYAVSKVGEDMVAYQYFLSYGLKTIRTRMFTHTGPRRGEVFVESAFAKQIAAIEKGLQPPVIKVGNLNSVRTFNDVRDAVKAYYLLTKHCQPGEVYNIGGRTTMTVGEMLNHLLELSPIKGQVTIEVSPGLLRPSDVTLQIPCIDKFVQATGWEPKIPFEQTMKDLLDFWRNELSSQPPCLVGDLKLENSSLQSSTYVNVAEQVDFSVSNPATFSGGEQAVVDLDIPLIIESLGEKFQILARKTVLVTDADSLIGSYFVDTVAFLNRTTLKTPCRLIGLYSGPASKGDRLYHALKDSNMTFIRQEMPVPRAFDCSLDYIIHVANSPDLYTSKEDPIASIEAGVKTLRWLLDLAVEKKVASFLYLSSDAVYGSPSPEYIPISEVYSGNVSPLSSIASYAESKRVAETLCFAYYYQKEVPIKIARPFLVYGPGLSLDSGLVLADFIKQAVSGKPIQLKDAGEDSRAYCYVSDALAAFWQLLFSDNNGDVFNVGNDSEEISIKDLAKLAHNLLGIKEGVIFGQSSYKAPKRILPDISKLQSTFNFGQKVLLKDGLKRTINWELARLGKPLLG